MSRMQMNQYTKDLKATIRRQKEMIERHQVAMSQIDVHNAMVRRILEQTLTKDREELPALRRSDDSVSQLSDSD